MGVSFNMWCLKNHKNIERKIIVKNNGSKKKYWKWGNLEQPIHVTVTKL